MYGDWVVPPPAPMGNKSLIASFALLHDLQMGRALFAGSAAAGAAARAQRCAWLFQRVAADFHASFFDPERGVYGTGLQTEQALPLLLGIVPSKLRAKVVDYAVDDIVNTNGMHTTSGILGIKAMLEVLTNEGRTDVALAMLQQDSYPSFGYMLKGGASGYEPATTLWELWDADVQGPSMNSRNHIMFGSVVGWMYKCLAGITPLKPGFAKASIRPSGVGARNLTFAEARVGTPHGDIAFSWTLEPVWQTCAADVPEGSIASLGCNSPADAIAAVTFASFGTPHGSCAANGTAPSFSKSDCDANRTVAVVEAQCVGKQKCQLRPSAVTWGEPCHGSKHLDVAVSCLLPPPPAGLQVLQVTLALPVGVDGRVTIPLGWGRDASEARVAEGSRLVWANGKFVLGDSSISSGKASDDGSSIVFELAPGVYHFVAS